MSKAYSLAIAEHNAALAEYRVVRDEYRARKVDNSVFLAAQAKRIEADNAFDNAFEAEQRIQWAAEAIVAKRKNNHPAGLVDELERGDINAYASIVGRYRLSISQWSAAMESAIEKCAEAVA